MCQSQEHQTLSGNEEQGGLADREAEDKGKRAGQVQGICTRESLIRF